MLLSGKTKNAETKPNRTHCASLKIDISFAESRCNRNSHQKILQPTKLPHPEITTRSSSSSESQELRTPMSFRVWYKIQTTRRLLYKIPKKSFKRPSGCLAFDLRVHHWSQIFVVRTTRSLDPWKNKHFPFSLRRSRLETRSCAPWEKLDHQSGWLHGRKDEMDGWVDRFLLHLNLYATNGSTNFRRLWFLENPTSLIGTLQKNLGGK